MGKKAKFWLALGIQLAVALAIAALLYVNFLDDLNTAVYEHKRYAAVPAAWTMYCASNALFVPGVMWLGVAGLMWIATTGFFDIFSYAFKSLLVLFSPLRKPGEFERFYDYKLAKEEKRSGKAVPYTMLIVGVVLVLGSAAFNIAYDGMLDEYLSSPAHQQSYQEAIEAVEGAEDDEASEDPAAGSEEDVLPEESEMTNDTTGGDNNE